MAKWIANFYYVSPPNMVWLPGLPTFEQDSDGSFWVVAESVREQLKNGDLIQVQIFSGEEQKP